MKKFPAIMFYTRDWLGDPCVSLCSPASRGIWFDLLCAMHESGRTGRLSGNQEQLARIARCQPSELALALDELSTFRAADVTERSGVVTVTNRRMQRESNVRKSNALRQQKIRESQSCHTAVSPIAVAVAISETRKGELGETNGQGPTKEMALRWLENWKTCGADYCREEMESAFLALSAGGWTWGTRPIVDYRAALERQIQTDRLRYRKKSKKGNPGGAL